MRISTAEEAPMVLGYIAFELAMKLLAEQMVEQRITTQTIDLADDSAEDQEGYRKAH